MKSTLKDYMDNRTKSIIKKRPTFHSNCIRATEVRDSKGRLSVQGVARPGKTRRDKARGSWKPPHIRKADARAKSEAHNDLKKRSPR